MIYRNETEFLREALQRGTIEFVKRNDSFSCNRFSVTVDSVTRFMNITDELWAALNAS